MKAATHIRINGGQYPLKFDVFLNFGNKDKPAMLSKIGRGISRATLSELRAIIQDTDIEDKAGWHFQYHGHYVVVIPLFNPDVPYYYGILHHELQHGIRESGRHLGYRQSEDCEEFYCYLHGHLTERIYRRLW